MKNIRTTIGSNHGKPHSRIWVEGARLVAAKFTVGARYNRLEGAGVLVLCLNPTGKYKVSGKGEKPIIDTTGAIVTRLFSEQLTHVFVSYSEGAITISNTPIKFAE